MGTPEGDALKVAGKLSSKLGSNPPLSFAGTFSASSANLLARWFPGGPVQAQGEINVALHDTTFEAQPGRVQIQQAGKSLLDVTILQPFAVNLDTHALTPRDPAQPVINVVLGRLPLGLLAVTDPGAVLGGYVDQGDFEGQRSLRGKRSRARWARCD